MACIASRFWLCLTGGHFFKVSGTVTAAWFNFYIEGKNMMWDENPLTISELASSLEISPSTIRYYEEKGLVSPSRTPGNQRVYTAKDRARLKMILRGKRLGCSLTEISEIIGLGATEVSEVCQIEKSLVYADLKMREVQEHKQALYLMEKDILSMKEALEVRLKELKG